MRLLLVFALALSGCATLNPRVRYSGFGEADPARDREALKRYLSTRDTPPPAASSVKVLVDTIPEGLEIKEGSIQVSDGYEHQVLGKFTAASGPGMYLSLLWFADYTSGFHKGYCYPQVPLTWVTLGMWGILVPLAFPCWGSFTIDKTDMIGHLKALGAAAGGNMVITGFATTQDQDSVFMATGFIIRADPRTLESGKHRPQKVAPPNQI
ncbi:MAG: hypothetical protein HYZ28_12940 [Myxococcales bacterium]|nr:hypothetical protein [Myxococcales bacterium]